MKLTRKTIVALLMMSIVPLCAMENEKNNVISDADLLAKKKAFALKLKSRKKFQKEYLHYPKDSNITVDVEALNQELDLLDTCKVIHFRDMFLIPAGMDEKFIHPTLVPRRRDCNGTRIG
jgi:hypothetical protein